MDLFDMLGIGGGTTRVGGGDEVELDVEALTEADVPVAQTTDNEALVDPLREVWGLGHAAALVVFALVMVARVQRRGRRGQPAR